MLTNTINLDVPEVRHYHRGEREGVVIVTCQVRQPVEGDWHLMRLMRLT